MNFTQARYEAFARLATEVDSRIERACKLYNSLLEEAGVPLSDAIQWHNGTLWLDDLHAGVDLEWETSWRYGGHDSGSNYIPMNCIIDDTWEEEVTKRAKETISNHQSKEQAKVKREDDTDREEFNRLKAKFEGED